MELILSVLLFSVTAAVCAQLFVRTHLREKQAKELQFVLTHSQTVTSVLRANTSATPAQLIAAVAAYYAHSESGTHESLLSENEASSVPALLIFYDQNFQTCPASETAAYRMALFFSENGGLLNAQLRFDALTGPSADSDRLHAFSDEALIRSLTVSLYQNRPLSRTDKEAK